MTHDADGKFTLVAVALNTPAYEKKKSIANLLLSHFLHLFTQFVQHWKVTYFHSLGSYKDSALGLTFKVSLSIHSSIILSRWLVQRDTYPRSNTRNLWHGTNECDCTTTIVSGGE